MKYISLGFVEKETAPPSRTEVTVPPKHPGRFCAAAAIRSATRSSSKWKIDPVTSPTKVIRQTATKCGTEPASFAVILRHAGKTRALWPELSTQTEQKSHATLRRLPQKHKGCGAHHGKR
jgi:hypothetical protein